MDDDVSVSVHTSTASCWPVNRLLWLCSLAFYPSAAPPHKQSEMNNAVIHWVRPLTTIYCVTFIICSAWDITAKMAVDAENLFKWLFSLDIATGGLPRLIAAACMSQAWWLNYCIKSECICCLSMTFISVLDDNPSSCRYLISKCSLFQLLQSMKSYYFVFPGQCETTVSNWFHCCLTAVIYSPPVFLPKPKTYLTDYQSQHRYHLIRKEYITLP